MTIKYGENFLLDYVGNIIRDPKVAIIEIIANAYDAGALNVSIIWPDEISKDFEIEDDGVGLSEFNFLERWETLSYNRFKTQGRTVSFPSEVENPPQRLPFGKNGKGRHAPFCFSDSYSVTSHHGNESFSYLVSNNSMNEKPFELRRLEVKELNAVKKHGLKISGTINENYINAELVEDLIKSKFLFDPTFTIRLNNKKLDLLSIENFPSFELEVNQFGKIKLYLIDSTESENKSRFKGVAWWVNKRLVGSPDWKNILDKTSYIDKRRSLAKKISFIVQADILSDCISADWTELYSTEKSKEVVKAVESFINNKLDEMMIDARGEEKEEIIRENLVTLSKLGIQDQKKMDSFIDQVQQNCKRIQFDDFSNIVKILCNLEASAQGYVLLDELAKLSPDELDKWTEIIHRWDVNTALTILNEIDKRLAIIKEIERKCDNPETKELLELHPLIERSLWVFGPEFEGIEYHSNKSLKTILLDKYQVGIPKKSKGGSRRPDFFISVVERDGYDLEGECSGTEKIVIIELKRGAYEIELKDIRQGQDYAYLLKEKHPELVKTKFVIWAIGSKVHSNVGEQIDKVNNIESYSMTYRVLVKRAHARLFQLKRKIEDVKGVQDLMNSKIHILVKEGVQQIML